MERNLILIDSIPTVVWGKESEKIYIYFIKCCTCKYKLSRKKAHTKCMS